MFFACNFENVDQTVHLYVPGFERKTLGRGGQQCRKVVDGVDIVFVYDFGYLLAVADVGLLGRAAFKQIAFWFRSGNISGLSTAFLRTRPARQ